MEDSIALRDVPPVVIVAAVLALFSSTYAVLQPPKAKQSGITDSAGYRVTPIEPRPARLGSMQIALTFVFHFGLTLAGCSFGPLFFNLFEPDWVLVYGLLFVTGCALTVIAHRFNRSH